MRKYKVGYTTGVFDLFHIGHLNILRSAKEQSEYLIVGVTSDEEAISVKNRRPVIPFEERIEIVRSIKYVDEAVKENNTDKLVAWDHYKFNAIFKGDDWKGNDKWIEYEKGFLKRKVKVVYFPYTKTTTSTILSKYLYNLLN